MANAKQVKISFFEATNKQSSSGSFDKTNIGVEDVESKITSSFNFNDSRGGAISNSRIKKIKEWLTKDVVKLSTPSENQYLSLTFLIPKKAAGHCFVLNLKKLNQYILYVNFKMHRLFPL